MRRYGLCSKCGEAPSGGPFGSPSDWCDSCRLLLHDPWLTRRCPHCHRSVTKDVGQFAGGDPPGTGEWRHPGFLLPYGGPDRCASLVQHYDAGHRLYDLWATREMSEADYVAAIERLRRLEDVQWVLRRVGAIGSLPPTGDGLIEHPRPPFGRGRGGCEAGEPVTFRHSTGARRLLGHAKGWIRGSGRFIGI